MKLGLISPFCEISTRSGTFCKLKQRTKMTNRTQRNSDEQNKHMHRCYSTSMTLRKASGIFLPKPGKVAEKLLESLHD
jgi:hypothetical protein